MTDHASEGDPDEAVPLGPALRRAWLGYQRRLDEGLAAAGFPDRGFPDGRILRLCRDNADTTISDIGRELEMSRQGAGKIVANLTGKGFVTLEPSKGDRREKVVTLTPRALRYLATQRKVAQAIEHDVGVELADQGMSELRRLLSHFGDGPDIRMRTYLRRMRHLGGLRDPNE